MSQQEVADALSVYIREKIIGNPKAPLAPETSMMDGSVVDSFGLVELLAFVDQTFGVRIEPQDIVPENFGSLSTLVAFIDAKRQAAAA